MNALFLPLFFAPQVALASEPANAPKPPPDPTTVEPAPLDFEERGPQDVEPLVLDTGRPANQKAEPGVIHFSLRGEYQVRYTLQRSFPLVPTATAIAAKPGLVADSIGQNQYISHWLRLTPRLQLQDNIEIVGQMDVVTGLVVGDLAHDVSADATPGDSYNGFSNVQPRWLYADIHTKVGLIRVGQQPSQWGMGVLANDGDHPSLFGDYRYGQINERLLFGTKPGGKDSDVTIAVAGDLVYRDNFATLTNGDHAFQGVLAALYEKKNFDIGVYGVYRNQTNDRQSGGADYLGYTDKLEVGVLDVFGRFSTRVPGANAYLFGQTEAAAIFGSTNYERTVDQAASADSTLVRSYGGAMQIGVAHVAKGTRLLFEEDSKKKTPFSYGDMVAQIEVGYASGDANPNDGTEHRFTFDPNHKVGLVLFDEVLRFQTARAATAAKDPLLGNGNRPPPGIDLYPSNGGIFGAEYINPTFVYRPKAWLDLKGGAVIAQTTADNVDPYRTIVAGNYVNAQGGDPKKHDLGIELDGGAEVRGDLDRGLVGTLGLQAGVLFPGQALADMTGSAMKVPWMMISRVGVLF